MNQFLTSKLIKTDGCLFVTIFLILSQLYALEEKATLNNSFLIQQNITGSVLEKMGNPLAGVYIIEKGTSNATQTDFDGNFSIDVESENAVLVVSYLGFVTQEYALNGGGKPIFRLS
ncbi:MAG: carboxypeptidase-like regulatory domain-containing protein [Flavobacteriaceae bacterium]|nr:carboxypeptidase-like regulatory domain-containing protein [Flavobacteriaceae bacterium]MCY4253149.1 carboxypeptidase-like regulatory domain-containing protein [Flavobacteriaceae bacterium]